MRTEKFRSIIRTIKAGPSIAAAALCAGLALGVMFQAVAPAAAAPGEIAKDGNIVKGPPITPETVKSAKHPKYPRGWTCAECHDVSFGIDVLSTASRQYMRNFGELPQANIWERIEAFIPGRERFVMATVFEDRPTATTVDMVLDQEEKMLYVISEKGTEKLMHLQVNPRISAVRNAGWSVAEGGARQWVSVQINGTVELISSDDERFLPILEKYQLVRINTERATRRFDIQRIRPEEVFYFDTSLEQQGFSVYQLWKRSESDDPVPAK